MLLNQNHNVADNLKAIFKVKKEIQLF